MLKVFTKKLIADKDLSKEEMEEAFRHILERSASDIEVASFLTALSIKGESAQEIEVATRMLRARCNKIDHSLKDTFDTCGTGGDGLSTFNISTISSIILASCGVNVLKHGNRAISSKCGSTDLLEALGISIDLTKDEAIRCVEETGFAFLFAPYYHPAMKEVAPIRKAMGIRTIFNLLGPLLNPAQVNHQIIGVFDEQYTSIYANVLKAMGVKRAMVVHGLDGMDEITLTGETQVSELKDNVIKTYRIKPEMFGFNRVTIDALKADSVEENKRVAKGILQGDMGPKTDIVLLNTGASLYIAGKAKDINEGILIARKAIQSGQAMAKLEQIKQAIGQLKGGEIHVS